MARPDLFFDAVVHAYRNPSGYPGRFIERRWLAGMVTAARQAKELDCADCFFGCPSLEGTHESQDATRPKRRFRILTLRGLSPGERACTQWGGGGAGQGGARGAAPRALRSGHKRPKIGPRRCSPRIST